MLQRSCSISFTEIQTQQPDTYTAEISLFGPGVGECVVIHYGGGRWFIVDSCLSPNSKVPIALEYLQSLGVNLATQVTGILITHWHSDHIDGVHSLISTCQNAILQAPSALSSKEALNLASLYKPDPFSDTDKEIREFRMTMEHLKKQRQPDRFRLVNARHVFFDDREMGTRLVALSPSEVAMTQAIERIREVTPDQGGRRTRLVAPSSENLNAVALHFSYGKFVALLGSDLEEVGNNNTGWSAVLNSNIDVDLSLDKASVYKVAHHGSSTGHHQGMWSRLLIPQPLALATPYSKSRLPTEEDVDRIKQLSSSFIITRNPTPKKKTKRDPYTDRVMRRARARNVINEKIGHVQIRVDLDGQYRVAINTTCEVYEKKGDI